MPSGKGNGKRKLRLSSKTRSLEIIIQLSLYTRCFKIGLIKVKTQLNKSGLSRNNVVTPVELEAGTYTYNSNSSSSPEHLFNWYDYITRMPSAK